MLRVVGHEDPGRLLDALALGLVSGVLVESVGKVKGGLITLESRHMPRRGLKGHGMLDPALQP